VVHLEARIRADVEVDVFVLIRDIDIQSLLESMVMTEKFLQARVFAG
jgi:hypothetical protein